MGLDMYLYAERYLSQYGDEDKEYQDKIKEMMPEIGILKPQGITLRAGYWRKANQIHKWFVDNVQDGEDNCARYYVGREKLTQLSELCTEVLQNPKLAEELLPTQSGFFFGGTEYDEYYMSDLKETVEMIDKALTLPDDWEFYYHSSW